MATAGDLVVNFIGKTQGLQQEANTAQKILSGFVSFASRALATVGLGVGVGASLSEAMELEKSIVQFKVLLGSQKQAVELMSQLRSFAAETPFQLGDIADSTKLLLNAGIAAEDMVNTLRMLGDLAAAGGKNLGEVAFVFAQVRTAGRLMGQDLNQLLNANIPAIKALAEEFGVAEGEVRDLVSTGAVTFERLESAMKRLTDEGGQLNGMTLELSQTMGGMWSTLKDNIGAAMAGLGDYIIEMLSLKNVLNDSTQAIQWLSDNIRTATKVFVAIAGVLAVYTVWQKRAAIATVATTAVLSKGASLLVDLPILAAATAGAFVALEQAEKMMGDEAGEANKKLDEVNKAMDQAADANNKAADTIDKMTDSMKGQKLAADALAKSQKTLAGIMRDLNVREIRAREGDEAARRQELRNQNVSERAIEHVLARERRVRELEQQRKQEEDRQRAFEQQDEELAMKRVEDIARMVEQAEELAKTPIDKFNERLAELVTVRERVGEEMFANAARNLAANTGLFEPREARTQTQQALTAVSGMDAISQVNQFNRDMEQRKAEAEKQRQRDEKARVQREAMIKGLEAVGVNTKPLTQLQVAEAVQ